MYGERARNRHFEGLLSRTYSLPYPPSANRYLRHGPRGVYETSEAKAYKAAVGLKLKSLGARKIEKPEHVIFTVTVFRPRASGDLDNTLKVLLDALNGCLWEDDSQVTEIHAYRRDDKANPRVEVHATVHCSENVLQLGHESKESSVPRVPKETSE